MELSQSSKYLLESLLKDCDPLTRQYLERNVQIKEYILQFLHLIHEDIQKLLNEKKITRLELIKTHVHDCIVLLFKHSCSNTDFEKDFSHIEEQYLSSIQTYELGCMIEQFIIDHETHE